MTCDDITTSLGVYLLGALDDTEQAAVEAHLGGCEHCSAELEDLAALPSLLSRLTPADFAVEPPEVPDDLFDRVAARAREHETEELRNADEVRRQAERRRYRRLTAVAAAVVVIAGATVGTVVAVDHHGGSGQRPVASQTAHGISNGISMRVVLASQKSGTGLSLKVTGLPVDEHCQLVAVTKDGTRKVVGQWYATYHGQAQVTGSTSIARSDLSQLVLLGTGGKHLVTVNV